MRKSKFFTLLNTLVVAAAPASLISITSCSKYEALTQEFKEQAIKEFMTIVKIPHTTGKTRQMADYLKEYFKPYIVENSWYEDNYRFEKSPTESSGNICFDVKATDGCELWPGVTLQGHYDMVAAGALKTNPKKSVDPVIEGNVIHSNHYETNLGADDGIGLGIIATLVKNQDKFKHGPLRILLTSDEEADTSGAHTIPTNTDKDMILYDNVINLDAEVDKRITVSCASTYSTNFEFAFETGEDGDFEAVTSTIYPYTVKISGLLGGHSANCINEGRLSAIKVAADILNKINYGNKLKIISISSNNESNEIATDLEMSFCCDSMMIDEIKNIVINPLINNYKKTNPIETKLEIDISETTIQPGQGSIARILNSVGSWKLYTLLRDAPFGPYEWIDEELKEVATSNNLGKLSFDANAQGAPQLKLTSFSRSCYAGDDQIIHNYINVLGQNIFGSTKVTFDTPETSPAWAPLKKNELFDKFAQGFKNLGITPTKRNAHSWLECAYFCQHPNHKNARMIAVGPYIKGAHAVSETLYLDTLDPFISSLLYTLTNINKM